MKVTITDTFDPIKLEEWSVWKKLGIVLQAPFNRCRCGVGKHIHWPTSPAEDWRQLTKTVAANIGRVMDEKILRQIEKERR